MSPSQVRVFAGCVAGIVVLCTAVAVGLLSRPTTCQSRTVAANPAVTATDGAGLGNAPAPSAAAQVAPGVEETVCQRQAFGAAASTVSVLGGVLAVLAVLAVLLAGGRGRGRVAPPAGSAAAVVRQVEADRSALIDAVIYVRDRLTSKALADRLGAALRTAGVTELEPAGAPFDPARHEAGGSTPSSDRALVGQIAAVEVPGYADRNGRLLRAPVVTVYQPGEPR